ncbi:MAG: hypothetical protein QM534_08180 [Sediminibacterium sp.]|nr:hypothetical protein [Sediminibacterium sp.]
MEKIRPICTIRTAVAGTESVSCFVTSIDAFDNSERYSRVFFYNELNENVWTYTEQNDRITSVCVWSDPYNQPNRVFAALSENGEVIFLGPNQSGEKIGDSGLSSDSKGYGYLNCIVQIGHHLFACGYSGQVYRRSSTGIWHHFDSSILQTSDSTEPKYFIESMNGCSENDIYCVGSTSEPGYPGRADYWNGKHWTKLDLPIDTGRLTNLYIESHEKIWLCGANGTLLCGNVNDGFIKVKVKYLNSLITSVTKFQECLFLATSKGIFYFDPRISDPVLMQVITNLQPPQLTDTLIVQSVEGYLWSIGSKKITRFDGKIWESIQHPDIPNIK